MEGDASTIPSGGALSLKDCFANGERVYQSVQDSMADMSKEETQKEIKMAMLNLMRAKDMVEHANLFSPNETLEDVSTSSLRYVFIPFYLSVLTYNLMSEREPDKRLKIVLRTKQFLAEFLENCERLEIVDKQDMKSWKGESEANPSQRREIKIERFKREKEARSMLTEIRRRRDVRKTGKKQDDDDEEYDDEEDMRQMVVLLLQSSCRRAMDDMSVFSQEEKMLTQVISMGIKPLNREKDSRMKPRKPMETVTIMPKAEIVPKQLRERQEIIDNVFVNRYFTTDTSSLEQLKYEEAMESREKEEAEQKKHAEEEYEKSIRTNREWDDVEEEEQRKAREWDDWKDANPKGAGNLGGNVG